MENIEILKNKIISKKVYTASYNFKIKDVYIEDNKIFLVKYIFLHYYNAVREEYIPLTLLILELKSLFILDNISDNKFIFETICKLYPEYII